MSWFYFETDWNDCITYTHMVVPNTFWLLWYADMKVEKNCTLTRDAVCMCEDGFRCSDINCEICVKVQTPGPTKPPVPTGEHYSPDTTWSSVRITSDKLFSYSVNPNSLTHAHSVSAIDQYTISLSSSLHPFAPFLSTSSRQYVDLGESVFCVCVSVRSAHLFPSHQQTWMAM